MALGTTQIFSSKWPMCGNIARERLPQNLRSHDITGDGSLSSQFSRANTRYVCSELVRTAASSTSRSAAVVTTAGGSLACSSLPCVSLHDTRISHWRMSVFLHHIAKIVELSFCCNPELPREISAATPGIFHVSFCWIFSQRERPFWAVHRAVIIEQLFPTFFFFSKKNRVFFLRTGNICKVDKKTKNVSCE